MLSPRFRSDPDDSSLQSPAAPSGTDPIIEAVALANYDHWAGHSVEVTVITVDGEPVLRERHYLPPDRSTGLSASIVPGEYELRVRVDGVERSRTSHRIDDTPTGTAVVELGNGVVSVTDGATGAVSNP